MGDHKSLDFNDGSDSPPGTPEKTKRATSIIQQQKSHVQRDSLKTRSGTALDFKREITALKLASEGGRDLPAVHSDTNTGDATQNIAVNPDSILESDSDEDDQTEEKDIFGRDIYNKTCSKLKLIPISSVLTDLTTNKVSVTNRGLETTDILAICNALLENRVVKTLVLDRTGMVDKGAEYVALLLKENMIISALSLADNKLGSTAAKLLAQMIVVNPSLVEVNLSGNNFSDNDAVPIARVIKRSKYLQNLNLSHNGFSDESAKLFGKAIAANDTLRVLDLSWNKFRPPGGVELCKGIEENVMLKTLNLSMNGLSSQGTYALARALMHNDSLTDLDVSENRIYDTGALELAKCLLRNDTLKKLKIGKNPLTTATAVMFLASIKENETTSMELLDMTNIPIYEEVLVTVQEIQLYHRPDFHFLCGGVVKSRKDYGNDHEVAGIVDDSPMTILKNHIAAHNLRLADMFKQFDKYGTKALSREEFVEGFEMLNIPITDAQLDDLFKYLDTNRDGYVDYAELMEGDRLHRMEERRKTEARKRRRAREERERKEKARLVALAKRKARIEEERITKLEQMALERNKARKGILEILPTPATTPKPNDVETARTPRSTTRLNETPMATPRASETPMGAPKASETPMATGKASESRNSVASPRKMSRNGTTSGVTPIPRGTSRVKSDLKKTPKGQPPLDSKATTRLNSDMFNASKSRKATMMDIEHEKSNIARRKHSKIEFGVQQVTPSLALSNANDPLAQMSSRRSSRFNEDYVKSTARASGQSSPRKSSRTSEGFEPKKLGQSSRRNSRTNIDLNKRTQRAAGDNLSRARGYDLDKLISRKTSFAGSDIDEPSPRRTVIPGDLEMAAALRKASREKETESDDPNRPMAEPR